MMRRAVCFAILAVGLCAVGCEKSSKEGGKARKTSGKGEGMSTPATVSKGPQGPANRIALFTMTATGPKDKRWQDFKGTFDMKSAILIRNEDGVFLVFGNSTGGCEMMKGVGSTGEPLRVTVGVPLSAAQRAGKESLAGKTFKSNMAVAYVRRFNALYRMNAESERTVHFVSGRVKAGETLKGWINVKEKIHNSDKHAVIRGNFALRVCKEEK